jgi:hypothetical protein
MVSTTYALTKQSTSDGEHDLCLDKAEQLDVHRGKVQKREPTFSIPCHSGTDGWKKGKVWESHSCVVQPTHAARLPCSRAVAQWDCRAVGLSCTHVHCVELMQRLRSESPSSGICRFLTCNADRAYVQQWPVAMRTPYRGPRPRTQVQAGMALVCMGRSLHGVLCRHRRSGHAVASGSSGGRHVHAGPHTVPCSGRGQWFQWWSCACCPSHLPRRAPRPRTQAQAVIRHETCPRMQRTLPPSLLRRHHRSKPPTTATPAAAQRFTSVPLIRKCKRSCQQAEISSAQTPHQQSLHSRPL